MPWYKKTIKAGDILETEIYCSVRTRGKSVPRERRKAPTTEAQAKLNDINRKKHFRRKINANFRPYDIYATLTYAKEPEEIEKAIKNLSNFIKRINYSRKKRGLDNIRYIAVTEYQGKRIHHHVIMERMSMDEIIKQWNKTFGAGSAELQTLYAHDMDYSNLSDYLLKETRNRRGKHWTESRNLIQPTVNYTRASRQDKKAMRGARPYIPKGYILTDEIRTANDLTGIMCYFKFRRTKPDLCADIDRPAQKKGEKSRPSNGADHLFKMDR